MELKESKTIKNLLRTFAGESRARNKYDFYAEKARREGYEYIASVFEETGGNEKAHAREVFNRYLGMVKSTEENLKDAASGEALESTKLYKQFESIAREEGFIQIADFYKELSEVEEEHMKRFMSILKNLEEGKIFERDEKVKWQCMNCGYIHIGEEAPNVCPLCKYPKAYFKIKCEDYK
ncbi:rubrerythrin [Clostridium thailandense]|uniref:rubrerythrin n=1 Tax=Clostridium thailandense TaxID=2794346 RepID=UPI0039891B20